MMPLESGAKGISMKSQSGFTLTELLAVISIAAILAALAAPSFRDMVRDNRVTASTNTLIAHLAFARSEAITRRTTVVLCRSADPVNITPVCGGGVTDWTTGWLVFANVGGESPPTFDGGPPGGQDILIKIGEGLTGELQLFSNATGNTHIEFDLDGTSTVPVNSTAVYALCDSRGAGFGRQIEIDELGRTRLQKADEANPLVSCTTPPSQPLKERSHHESHGKTSPF